MTRLISLLLCAIMLFSIILTAVSCGKSEESTETTTAATTTAAVSGDATTEATTTAPEVDPYEPAQENFGDANGKPTDFNMLVRAARYGYLYDDGTSPERVNAAAYQRNMMIEEKYNIKINIIEKESTASVWNTTLLSSNGEYDLACFDYWWGIEQSGLLYDLMTLPEISVSDPHWYQGWNDNCTINGKLFSIAGDATLEVLENIEILFFNKDMAKINNLDLYGLVQSGDWTMDKMNEVTLQLSANLDNDNKDDDVYGALYDVHSVGCMPYSAGMKMTNIKEDGSIAISENKDALIRAGEACADLIHNGAVRYDTNTARSTNNQGVKLFTNESAMFYATALYLGQTLRKSNTGFDYGVLVPPKLDKEAEYVTGTYGASLFGIPLSVADAHKSAVILDALNYYSNDTVVDAFYEIVLKYQVADSEEDAGMIEMARDVLYMDFAYIYTLTVFSSIKNAIINNSPFASILAANTKVSQKELQKLVAAYN